MLRFFLIFALVFWNQGHAGTVPTLPTLMVRAKRDPSPHSSISVITSQTLETNQQETVLDAIKDLPGVHVVQQGGAGRTAQIFLRGGNSGDTLVFIDGMRANDPSTPNGSFDFANLGVEGVETIQVIRGPHAAQYGSDALSGVVHVKTGRGQGTPSLKATTEGGSFETLKQTASAQGKAKALDFNINLSHLQTQGTPSTPIQHRTLARQWGPEPYGKDSFSSRLGADLTPNLHFSLWNRYQHTRSRYVNEFFLNPSMRDIGFQSLNRAQLEGRAFGDRLKPTLGIGYVEQERRSGNDIAPFLPKTTNQGQTLKMDLVNQIKVTDIYDVYFGLEKEQQSYRSDNHQTSPIQGRADEKDVFLGNVLNPHQRVKLEGWGRYHRHSQFGGETTYKAGATYRHPETKTEFYTNYGTAIKAPALFQLFDINSGNPNLQPEKSHGYELGVRQTITPKIEVGTAAFRNLISRMIANQQTAPQKFTYLNINNAETRGLESFVCLKPTAEITARLEHTYLRAKDLNNRQQLSRRPLHKVAAKLDFKINEAWELGMGAIYNGKQADISRFSPYDRVYQKGVTVIRLYTTYHYNKHCDLFGRIENALNRHYEEPSGYSQPGLAVFCGVRVRT